MSTPTLIGLVVLFPILGALFNGLFGWLHGRRISGYVACSALGASFLAAVAAVWQLAGLDAVARTVESRWYTWIDASTVQIDMAFVLDPLSAVMILVVTGVGFLIHVYSVGYMAHDEGRVRYFTYLNLFVFFMLVLVLGSSLPVMFLGWEGVGLCSYLLIGFWFADPEKAQAGKKAFLVNRVGDMFFVLGIFLIFWTMHDSGLGTLSFIDLKANAHLLADARIGGIAVPALAAFCFFVGATGKSAQIPLYIWLPDAMAGPTPVSALIHAATMVTAGVYMVARLAFLFEMSPGVMALVAWVGALTALFAALIGLAATDIKKVLAYSTISQLGYMFVGVGVGGYVAGIFHLVTHAFFKGLLFLGAGSVIHGVGTQDIRKMGGIRQKMPWTFWTFFVGTWAIAGLPPFSGFFSKDEILFHAYASPHGSPALWLVGWVTGGLTAFYMFRLFALTFLGQTRLGKKEYSKVHESPRSMTAPLAILAGLSAIGGLLGLPHAFHAPHLLGRWLGPALPESHLTAGAGTELALMGASVLAALAGTLLALHFYYRSRYVPLPDNGKVSLPARMARDKFYVDEFYDGLVVDPMKGLARFLAGPVDVSVIDRIVADWPVRVSGWLAARSRELQDGNTQRYLAALFAGALAFLAYLTLFGIRLPLGS